MTKTIFLALFPVHWLGANAILLPVVTLGINSVINSGSTVMKDVPDYSIAAGSPAKIIGKM